MYFDSDEKELTISKQLMEVFEKKGIYLNKGEDKTIEEFILI